MDQNRITYEHLGRRTIIHTPISKDSLEKFKDGLKENKFTILKDRAIRGFHVSTNDWPILITFSPHEDFYELTASMYIPLFWFIINTLAIIVAPPLLWYFVLPMRMGLLLEFTVLYFLILFVICYLTFNREGAKPKQVFDLSLKDSWQNMPRKKWNRIITDLLEKNFGVMVYEVE
jgi:hypothetical protein